MLVIVFDPTFENISPTLYIQSAADGTDASNRLNVSLQFSMTFAVIKERSVAETGEPISIPSINGAVAVRRLASVSWPWSC